MIVGEWSLAMSAASESPLKLDAQQTALWVRAFAATQLFTYEQTRGWFFWSYKTEGNPVWSFRESVEVGYLPSSMPG